VFDWLTSSYNRSLLGLARSNHSGPSLMSTCCAVCRAEFPSEKGFRRRPVGKGRFERLCPGCSNRQAESTFRFAVLCFLGMMVLGSVLFDMTHFGSVLLFLGTLLLTGIFSMIPHELGHALAAMAVGMRLFTVSFGAKGRILFVRQVLGHDFAFHAVLLGGYVLYTPKYLRFARLRDFVAVLAGPLANGLLLTVALYLLAGVSSNDRSFHVLAGFIYGSVLVLAISLFPRKYRVRNARTPNDGLLVLTIPFRSRKSLEAWHSLTFYYEAIESLKRGNVQDAEHWLAKGMVAYPDNWWAVIAQADVLSHQHKYAEARELYLRASNQPESTQEFRAYMWNAVAWMDLLIATPALLEEAEQFSRQALEEIPSSSYIRGTRGCVLVELGRIDEGLPLVEQALRENDRASEKASDACYVAIAMIERGDTVNGRKYIEKAQGYDSNCPLLERANKRLNERVELV
jgi:tetratricopeptide (TPR) repeat protein